jgi:hypothetical protein
MSVMVGRVVEPGAVTRALLTMVRDGVDDRVLAERICLAYMGGLDIDGAAISLLSATSPGETLWASDPIAELVEDLQATLNEGACVQAARHGSPVSVPDLRDSSGGARWPLFAAAVAEQTGVAALFALPLQFGAINLGVLDLYRLAPGALALAQWRDALGAADIAALMLLTLWTDPKTSNGQPGDTWLDHSLGGRPEIHQATGMVLVQLGISAIDALARLRAYAFVEQRLLIDVARDVVARRLRFTRDMG